MLAALVALTVVIVVLIANIKRLNRAESVLEQSEEHLRLAVEGPPTASGTGTSRPARST